MPSAKTSNGKRVNKMEFMRQTVKELGKDASAKEIQNHLKSEHGVDMSIDMIYTYKGTAIKQLAKGMNGRKGKRRGRKPGKAPTGKAGGSVSMADIQAVKAVVDRLGAHKVQQLAAVLG
jgi:hypothetical protein